MGKEKHSVTWNEVFGVGAIIFFVALGLFFIARNEGNLKARHAHGGLVPENDSAEQTIIVPISPDSPTSATLSAPDTPAAASPVRP